MICGKLSAGGVLTDVRQGPTRGWDDGSQDVELSAMPSTAGPWGYDPATQTATVLLSGYKDAKIAAIDARTEQLKAAGFSFTLADGTTHVFAGDATSKSYWDSLALAAAALSYPYPVETIDHAVVTLAGAAEAQAFYGALITRGSLILVGNPSASPPVPGAAQLKAQVQAATTQAGVDAVTDSRT